MIEYKISELLKQAAEQIAQLTPHLQDGRIQNRPDVRTLRYYQGQGLIDKPVRYDGREAIYGQLHLQQLVIIKLLQIEGYKLRQIQKRLAGIQPHEIEALYQNLGLDSSPSVTSASPAHRQLISVELQKGVVLTLDPALISDPNSLISTLTTALHTWRTP